ncbi:MAG: transcription antitermination factor NusB [Elusimicrobiota bacterium]
MRRRGRECALQMLYTADVCSLNNEQIKEAFWRTTAVLKETKDFAEMLFEGVREQLENIDQLVTDYAQNWELKRMAAIDRCILRLATYELLHCKEVPVKVVINEAVDLAKLYSTLDSGKFVNGVLDKIKLVITKGCQTS